MRAAALVLLLLTGPALADDAPKLQSGPARVLDGDTLRVGPWRIRLFGIDAPELDQDCLRNMQIWLAGEAAADWLTAWIAGRDVSCSWVSQDRYGRPLAVCTVAGQDMNEALVLNGMAFAYHRYSEKYAAAESVAQRHKLGIWGAACGNPEEVRAAKKRQGD